MPRDAVSRTANVGTVGKNDIISYTIFPTQRVFWFMVIAVGDWDHLRRISRRGIRAGLIQGLLEQTRYHTAALFEGFEEGS